MDDGAKVLHDRKVERLHTGTVSPSSYISPYIYSQDILCIKLKGDIQGPGHHV